MLQRFLLLSVTGVLVSCNRPSTTQELSFYYWKSVFSLNEAENNCLTQNNCKSIYVKYFDVVKEDGITKPVATIIFNHKPPLQNIIPVIFIKNNVFQDADSVTVEKLAKKTLSLVDQINFSNSITPKELQIDCDWTEQTRRNFFCFLRNLKKLFKDTISATIRLHQVKYKTLTGVPPVDKGVLMFYNIGEINDSGKNSIYDKATANKYLNPLHTYRLALDIALPIFTWGIQLRDNKVIGLLNKMNEGHFRTDTNFIQVSEKNYRVKNPGFKEGYYFQKNDAVKIEFVTQDELFEIAAALKANLASLPKEIIFYDLDSVNLLRYDETVFKKILDRFK